MVLLMFTLTMWGQTELRVVNIDTKPVVAQMTICLPLVEANDNLVTLKCDGVEIILPKERINGNLTIVIHPSDDGGPLTFKKTVHWYLAPKSYYRDSLGIILH